MVISTPLKIPDWMFLLQIYFLAVLVIPVTANKEPIELAHQAGILLVIIESMEYNENFA